MEKAPSKDGVNKMMQILKNTLNILNVKELKSRRHILQVQKLDWESIEREGEPTLSHSMPKAVFPRSQSIQEYLRSSISHPKIFQVGGGIRNARDIARSGTNVSCVNNGYAARIRETRQAGRNASVEVTKEPEKFYEWRVAQHKKAASEIQKLTTSIQELSKTILEVEATIIDVIYARPKEVIQISDSESEPELKKQRIMT